MAAQSAWMHIIQMDIRGYLIANLTTASHQEVGLSTSRPCSRLPYLYRLVIASFQTIWRCRMYLIPEEPFTLRLLDFNQRSGLNNLRLVDFNHCSRLNNLRFHCLHLLLPGGVGGGVLGRVPGPLEGPLWALEGPILENTRTYPSSPPPTHPTHSILLHAATPPTPREDRVAIR